MRRSAVPGPSYELGRWHCLVRTWAPRASADHHARLRASCRRARFGRGGRFRVVLAYGLSGGGEHEAGLAVDHAKGRFPRGSERDGRQRLDIGHCEPASIATSAPVGVSGCAAVLRLPYTANLRAVCARYAGVFARAVSELHTGCKRVLNLGTDDFGAARSETRLRVAAAGGAVRLNRADLAERAAIELHQPTWPLERRRAADGRLTAALAFDGSAQV